MQYLVRDVGAAGDVCPAFKDVVRQHLGARLH